VGEARPAPTFQSGLAPSGTGPERLAGCLLLRRPPRHLPGQGLFRSGSYGPFEVVGRDGTRPHTSGPSLDVRTQTMTSLRRADRRWWQCCSVDRWDIRDRPECRRCRRASGEFCNRRNPTGARDPSSGRRRVDAGTWPIAGADCLPFARDLTGNPGPLRGRANWKYCMVPPPSSGIEHKRIGSSDL
jgi:hypothetical protein